VMVITAKRFIQTQYFRPISQITCGAEALEVFLPRRPQGGSVCVGYRSVQVKDFCRSSF
jgi:hypothetical protein